MAPNTFPTVIPSKYAARDLQFQRLLLSCLRRIAYSSAPRLIRLGRLWADLDEALQRVDQTVDFLRIMLGEQAGKDFAEFLRL